MQWVLCQRVYAKVLLFVFNPLECTLLIHHGAACPAGKYSTEKSSSQCVGGHLKALNH